MREMSKLFHPFIATHEKDNWSSYTSPRMEFFNDDTIIPDVAFAAGFLVAVKRGFMDIPHIHDGADNYFIFTGADLENIFESEFEVDFFIGDSAQSMEVYHITKPSFIRVPAGVWHCPVFYKKVVRGLNNILWYGGVSTGRVYPGAENNGKSELLYEKDNWVRPCVRDPEKLCTWCGFCFDQTEQEALAYVAPFYENASATDKYKDCVMELRQDHHKLGDAVMSPRAAFKGVDDMSGADRQFSFNTIVKPCVLGDDEPVSNGQVAEFLWFSGTDVVDPWDCFDAEIEIMLGEDPGNMQAVTFDKPGVVAVPPGFWRGSINVKRAGKPICFIPWYQHSDKRYKITQKTVDGRKRLIYDDEATIENPTAGDELFMQISR